MWGSVWFSNKMNPFQSFDGKRRDIEHAKPPIEWRKLNFDYEIFHDCNISCVSSIWHLIILAAYTFCRNSEEWFRQLIIGLRCKAYTINVLDFEIISMYFGSSAPLATWCCWVEMNQTINYSSIMSIRYLNHFGFFYSCKRTFIVCPQWNHIWGRANARKHCNCYADTKHCQV